MQKALGVALSYLIVTKEDYILKVNEIIVIYIYIY